MQLQTSQILDGILGEALADQPLSFDEQRATGCFLKAEANLHETTVTYSILAPVIGLAKAPTMRLGQVELDRLTDQEAQLLLDNGLLQMQAARNLAHATTAYCFRQKVLSPKLVGNVEPLAPLPDINSAGSSFSEVLNALRLIRSEPIALPAIICADGQTTTWSRLPIGPLPVVPTYNLEPEDVDKVERVLARLTSPAVRKRRFIDVAVRRIGYASERHRVEDRLIDLVVAAEALFLGEDAANSTGELTYKISTRFALYAQIPGTRPRDMFDHMKKAYGARSKIVHGDTPKGLKKPGDLDRLASLTGDYLRWVILRMLDEAQDAATRSRLVDWEGLILGDRETLTLE